jgi:hypothetical protein
LWASAPLKIAIDGEWWMKISFWSLPRMMATSTSASRQAWAMRSSAALQRAWRLRRSSSVSRGSKAASRWASSSG